MGKGSRSRLGSRVPLWWLAWCGDMVMGLGAGAGRMRGRGRQAGLTLRMVRRERLVVAVRIASIAGVVMGGWLS